MKFEPHLSLIAIILLILFGRPALALFQSDKIGKEMSVSELFDHYESMKYKDPVDALAVLTLLNGHQNRLSHLQKATIHAEKALQFTYLLEFDSAYSHGKSAISDTLRDPQSQPARMAASILGNLFAERQLADSSYFYHLTAINKTDPASDDYPVFLSNYAVSLTRFQAYVEAAEHYKDAYNAARELGNNTLIAHCIMGLILTESKQEGRYKSDHITMLSDALPYLKDAGEIYLLKQNMAVILAELGNYAQADSLLDQLSVTYPEIHQNPNPNREFTRASIYLKTGRYRQTVKNLRSILEDFPEFNRLDEVYLLLFQAYAHLGMPDSSTYFSKLLFFLNDQRRNETNANALRRSEENLELYQTKYDLLSAKNVQTQKELQIKNQLLIIALLIISGLLAGAWFYRVYQRKKKALSHQSTLLSEKSKNLTLAGLEIARKKEWLQALKSVMDKSSAHPEEINRILKRELVKLNRVEKDWANFINYFNDLYDGFYQKLRERSAQLTTNDLRLASLIRLELSNGEIADLLNVSSDSVKSSKYRLKKKLELSEEEDLSHFISRI